MLLDVFSDCFLFSCVFIDLFVCLRFLERSALFASLVRAFLSLNKPFLTLNGVFRFIAFSCLFVCLTALLSPVFVRIFLLKCVHSILLVCYFGFVQISLVATFHFLSSHLTIFVYSLFYFR